jgi:hypothetical protein
MRPLIGVKELAGRRDRLYPGSRSEWITEPARAVAVGADTGAIEHSAAEVRTSASRRERRAP